MLSYDGRFMLIDVLSLYFQILCTVVSFLLQFKNYADHQINRWHEETTAISYPAPLVPLPVSVLRTPPPPKAPFI